MTYLLSSPALSLKYQINQCLNTTITKERRPQNKQSYSWNDTIKRECKIFILDPWRPNINLWQYSYIPLQSKILTLGPCIGLDPQCENFTLGIPTCLYLKTLKFTLPATRNIKFALPPTQNPNASHWNIVWVGSPGVGSRIGHVHLIFFVSISFALGSQFLVEYGL